MVRVFAFVVTLLAFALPAQAGLELLPGSSPQRADAGYPFQPVRVRATDASGIPVSGARVVMFIPLMGGVIYPYSGGCYSDAGYSCPATTDSQGVAELPRVYGVRPGEQSIRIIWLSEVVNVTFTVDEPADRIWLEVVSGAGQRVAAGSDFAPIAVRVLNAARMPLAGIDVGFLAGSGPEVTFAGEHLSARLATTGPDGIAKVPLLTAGRQTGGGSIQAYAYPPGSRAAQFATIDYTITAAVPLELTDMWWAGASESGWGVGIAQHGDRYFAALFVYDERGDPRWRVLSDGRWSSSSSTVFGNFYAPRGAPYYAYDAKSFEVGPARGSMRFEVESGRKLRFQVSTPEQHVVKPLLRQDYTSDTPSPLTGLGDMWWGGPSQNGWGIALMEQHGGLFSVWMTYDDAGLPTWFVMPSGSWTSASTFEGDLIRTSGPTWPGFDTTKLRFEKVGTFRYRFHSRESATFDWTVGAHSGSSAIERFPF
jgi:hypothetical protein